MFFLYSDEHAFTCTKADASDLMQAVKNPYRIGGTILREVPARCTALRESARKAIAAITD